MGRLTVTLDAATSAALARHARALKALRATLARELIREALAWREVARRHRLARDHAAGRDEAKRLLSDLELAQIELP